MCYAFLSLTVRGGETVCERKWNRPSLAAVSNSVVLTNSGRICGLGATLWCRNPLLSSNKSIGGHLMKRDRLVTDVTAIRSPGRAKRAILGVILAGFVFGQFRTYLCGR